MARYPTLQSIEAYRTLNADLASCPPQERLKQLRHLCRTDLYFLLFWALGRSDIEHPWLLKRCQEVQTTPNGCLDVWAREHYKSTIITLGKSIQDVLASHGEDPLPEWHGQEVTLGIFSCTRPIAKGFLRQIKREFEHNTVLKQVFPDVLYDHPKQQAPKWSEDDGLIVKRRSNPKESTIEAWELVDGQPTSKHFLVRVYDDVVTLESVRSPHMIQKVTEAWELSTNLGAKESVSRTIGTRYHFNDTYRVMIDRGVVQVRQYTPYDDGTFDRQPVLMSADLLNKKRRAMGPYTFSAQMMQNPLADQTQGFQRAWMRYYDRGTGEGMNRYLLVDPASEKKTGNDYTAIVVVGLGSDQNYYVLDILRDRLNLTERAEVIFDLHRQWQLLQVGYEHYGMQADIPFLNDRMSRENYRFSLVPLGGPMPKNDRIRRLVPFFEQSRVYVPRRCFKTNYEGKTEDLVEVFLHQEYLAFPVARHDDLLDALSRILEPDLGAIFPRSDRPPSARRYASKRSSAQGSVWAA